MKDWTIMVYMAGDNNLSDDMVTGLIGLNTSLALSKNNIAVLAFYDTSAIGIPTVLFDFTDNTVENLNNRTFGSLPPPKTLKEVRTSTKSIYKFVEWCVHEKKHEAHNYALILSGHGEGYQQDTFLSDKNPFSYITLTQLGKMLETLTAPKSAQTKSWSLGQKFSVLGFDSCVMNTIETADELAVCTDIIIGSQGIVPSSGWDYGKFIQKLQNHSSVPDKETVAEMLCSSFIESNKQYALRSGRSIDISTCDLRSKKETKQEFDYQDIADGVNSLGKSLRIALENPLTERQVEQIILNSHWKCQTVILDQAVDIFDFCQILSKECSFIIKQNNQIIELLGKTEKSAELEEINKIFSDIKQICKNTNLAVKKCVKFSFLGPDYQWGNGLSLFFPWSLRSFALTRKRYSSYKFGGGKTKPRKKSEWLLFLESYLIKTFRPFRKNPNKDSNKRSYLFNLEKYDLRNLTEGEKRPFELGVLRKKWSPPNPRWSPPNPRGVSPEMMENFRRTKNFPWLPIDWDPTYAD